MGPPGHPLAQGAPVRAAELLHAGIIAREAGSGTRAVLERALIPQGLRLTPLFCLNSTEAIKRTVAAGLGVAVLSALEIANPIDPAAREAHAVLMSRVPRQGATSLGAIQEAGPAGL